MTPNQELLNFIHEYRKDPCDKKLEKQFQKIKRFLRLNSYNDPSNVLDHTDIENIAFFGFWKAINKFDESRWENAIGWCFYVVRQQILREINKVYKKGTIPVIRLSHFNSQENEWSYDQLENYSSDSLEESQFIIDLVKYYIKDIQILCFELESVNVRASLTFQLKLCFPEISRDSIAQILGFKKRTGLAKIVRMIRAISKKHLSKELTSL